MMTFVEAQVLLDSKYVTSDTHVTLDRARHPIQWTWTVAQLLHTPRNAAGVIFLSKPLSQAAGIERDGTKPQIQLHPHQHLEADSRSQSVWQDTSHYYQQSIDSQDLGLAGTLLLQNHAMDLCLGSLDEPNLQCFAMKASLWFCGGGV
jgi:hypothetical protein